MKLFSLLGHKTFSKQGYAYFGWILQCVLEELTKTYPKDERFVNPEIWQSDCQLPMLYLLAPLISI